jgi:hypothetical protein
VLQELLFADASEESVDGLAGALEILARQVALPARFIALLLGPPIGLSEEYVPAASARNPMMSRLAAPATSERCRRFQRRIRSRIGSG